MKDHYKGESAAELSRGAASRSAKGSGEMHGPRWRGRLLACIGALVLAGACASDDKVTPPPSDRTPPAVTALFPTNGSSGISVSTTVSVTFSEEIDPSSVKPNTLGLSGSSGQVNGTVDLVGDDVVQFTPQQPLASNDLYTATITTDVTDMAGNPLEQNEQWTFTTASTPVADAGENRDADMGELVILDGSESFHPDGKSFDYEWKQVPGERPTVALIGANDAKPRFTAPNEVVTLEFELIVTSSDGPSPPDRVQVLVLEDKANAIFVSTNNGDDGNPGTRTDPFETIMAAISASLNRGTGSDYADIYVAEGTYNEHVNLVTQINVFGGFAEGTLPDTTWARQRPDPDSPSNETIITGGSFKRGPSMMAVEARTQNNITIDGLTITSKNATDPGGSSFAVSLWNADAITVSRCRITAGTGARGADGGNFGSAGAPGEAGWPGRSGACDIACPACAPCGGPSGFCNTGGLGGGRKDAQLDPGDGGDGGVSGQNCGCHGNPGQAVGTLTGGAGGTAPSGTGADGKTGATGTNGTGGADFGGLATLGYNGSSGGTGGEGGQGSGGGGGAGGGGAGNCSGSGGGGGQGGEGGDGGRGGSGGGGSFGIGVGFGCDDVNIVGCTINTSEGGDGGTGRDGYAGGAGGDPGKGASPSGGGGPGGDGGMGGTGGQGGPGGGGGGGSSIAIVVHYNATTNPDAGDPSVNTFPRASAKKGVGGSGGQSQNGEKGADGKLEDYYQQTPP